VGVRSVKATATSTKRCASRRRKCKPRSKTATGKAGAGGQYTITLRLKPGKYRVAIVATDALGRVQADATRLTLSVRRGR
jgi:hypothetical protein